MRSRAGLFRRAVRSRAARASLAAGGVAASTLLVLVLFAGRRAVTTGVAAYAGQEAVDLWVAPAGTDNLIRSSAVLPLSVAADLAARDGVARSGPLIRSFVSARVPGSDDRPVTLLAMGYDGPDGLGGPVELEQGRRPRGPEEAALDRAAAYRLGVTLDDAITVNDREVRVVGITRGTDLVATQFVFLDASEAEEASGFRGSVSFIALDLEIGADVGELVRAIEREVPQAVVHRSADFVRNNVAEVTAGFGEILLLFSTVGVLSAALLVALLVQGAVDNRRRDIAVLLAIGASIADVAVGVAGHVAGIVGGGVLVGAGASMGLGAVVTRTLPTVPLEPAWGDLAVVLGVFALAGLGAAAIPLWRLRRIDPGQAFRP